MPEFDPYLVWLDIPINQRPVSSHRLLGLNPGETNASVVESAAARVVGVLQQHVTGAYANYAHSLLAAVEQAKSELLGSERRPAAGSAGSPMKPPPPVPGTASAASASAQTGGIERQIQSAPPPPGSAAPAGTRHESQISPPPPIGGAPTQTGPTSTAASSLPPPPAPAGGAASSAPSVHSAPGPTANSPATSPPPASPPPASAQAPVVPVAQPTAQHQPPPPTAPPESAPTWAPQDRSGTVGKSLPASDRRRPVSIKTHKAKSFRSKVRRESAAVTYSIILGVSVIIIGLIVLLALVAFSS